MLNDIIRKFIEKQKTATVCCLDEEGFPYCFSCYYLFEPDGGLLLFKSSASSRHYQYLLQEPRVAGTILPNKADPLVIRGLQFGGIALDAADVTARALPARYHKKFPFARVMPGEVCALRLDTIKMTDSTKGFGKKIAWQRSDEPERYMNSQEQLPR